MSDLIHGLKTSFPKYHVYVGAPRQEPYFSIYQKEAVDCYELPFRRFSVSRFLGLWRFIRRNKISLVHSHGRGAGVYSRLLKVFLPDLRVIHTFHGCFHEHSFLGWMKVKLDQMLEPFADFYLSVSRDEYPLLINLGFAHEKKCLMIPNGVEVAKISPTASHGSQSLGSVTIGALARWSEQKGWDLLFQHLAAFVEQFPEFKIRFKVGGFPENQLTLPPALEGLIEEVGEIQSSAPFLKEIDIYVSSSRMEGLPLTVLEAMGAGVPCLLSEVPGHQYFMDHGVAVGFALQSSQHFCEQLKRLLTEPALRAQLEKEGRQFVCQYHSLKIQVRETVKIYTQVAAQPVLG